MDERIRFGLVGAGSRGRHLVSELYKIRDRDELYSKGKPEVFANHASERPPWFRDVSDIDLELTAVFDPDRRSREQAFDICDEAGDRPDLLATFDAFRSYGGFDAVLVCSPNNVHVEHVPPLLDDGYDVLCEKPLATTLSDHDEMIDAAAGSSSLFYPAFNLRTSIFFRRVKEMLDRGAVGPIGSITCHEVRMPFAEGYRYTRERSGSAILEKNCHDFDLFNWFAESDPVRVFALGNQHVLDKDSDIVDQATVVVEYEEGVIATLELCLYAPFNQRTRKYEIRGRDGILRSPEADTTIELFERLGKERHSSKTEEIGGHMGADLAQMERFLRCLRGKAEPPATALDAKKAAAVAIGAETAIREGTVVEIDDQYDVAC